MKQGREGEKAEAIINQNSALLSWLNEAVHPKPLQTITVSNFFVPTQYRGQIVA